MKKSGKTAGAMKQVETRDEIKLTGKDGNAQLKPGGRDKRGTIFRYRGQSDG